MDLTITDFLWLRITEDQEVAQRITHATWAQPNWELRRDGHNHPYVDLGTNHLDAVSSLNDAELEHIARHDPARVLRHVETVRGLLALAERLEGGLGEDPSSMILEGGVMAAQKALQWAALPYVDHPDYRQEWRP